MRDLIKLFLVGVILLFAPLFASAEQYKVVILPDNIVTEDLAVDSYIYNQTSEFFANEVSATEVNKTYSKKRKCFIALSFLYVILLISTCRGNYFVN